MLWPTIAIAAVAAAAMIARAATGRVRALRKQIDEQQREIDRLRDRHELAEERAEAQRRALFNSMVDGFLLLDREGRVLAINDTLIAFFGLSAEPRGKAMNNAFGATDLSELWEMVQRGEQVRGFDVEIPGEPVRYLEVSGAALRSRWGGIDGAVFIFHEVTRLRRLENTRREFVANVSHELRTPLTLIKGFVETLLGGARNDPVVAERFLQTIAKHADRLTFLIEDLLTISSLESGQITLNCQRLSLHDITQRVFDELQTRDAGRPMTFVNRIDENIEVTADADRLQQVLFNLVDNAVKYARAEVRVEAAARAREDGFVEVSILDNGPGIPPESIERVFERFYRVDRARSREQGGTGLGLAIVKHIIQSHGGEVWVRSELGKGAEFFFTLPPSQSEA